ncbi:exonuclease domain-containing protein [Propionibacteriaceae bacterium G1746]
MKFTDALPNSPTRRRRRALAAAPPGALHDFLAVDPPTPDTPVDELGLLAIDLETTGFDPATDLILSVGFVPVDGRRITLGGARRILVAQPDTGAGVGESATIHGLTDDQVATEGLPLAEVLDLTLAAMQGRALLAHYSNLETGFLGAACRLVHGVEPPWVDVDTLDIAYRLLTVGHYDEPPRQSLRLWAARARFGLPTYKAHDALTDALACAELYLALVEEPHAGATLRDLQR